MTATGSARGRTALGRLLRHWRGLRGLSQLELASRVGTSPRHLSFIETGRSRPRREMVLRLAEVLDVPLRRRNEWLVAAGLPPAYPEHELDSPALAPYRRALGYMLGALEPCPAFVLDGTFTIVDANDVARRLFPQFLGAPGTNLLDAFMAPGPGREHVANFSEVAWAWHARLLHAAAGAEPDSALGRLLARVEGYLRGVTRPEPDAAGDLVVCPTLRIDGRLVRTIGLAARFGPSRDVTLQELVIDVLYPRDEEAARFFRAVASERGATNADGDPSQEAPRRFP